MDRRTLIILTLILQNDSLLGSLRFESRSVQPGLPDFSWYKIPKLGEIFQMTTKYTKWPYNISNGRKIDQMVLTYTKISHC
jgi:hypothetical protein